MSEQFATDTNVIYIINIGDFVVGETVYPNRCLSASFGGTGIPCDTIPWEGTDYNPWDYKYEEEAFWLDPIDIPVPTPEPTPQDVLEAQVTYTALMTNTLL